ncbi:Holo-(acyl-carrier-protein) synthase [Candidatus Xenohaliotis californiensis]|uniref:Holo-[acyl-carrier-protein] synthase n=1 Tax=Candidatus Xenohaliotis californiensis TaxID=84677 RepID=A0ABP0EUN3_9RICK|nr:Holo-(acyl-carrier-protein) synthase [Candidatus Xenohaliotis californiensis]
MNGLTVLVMINGIGIDIVHSVKLSAIFKKRPEKFLTRVYNRKEIDEFYIIKNKMLAINYLAKRFAVKEAFAKATGFGIGLHILLKEIFVEKNHSGSPKLKLTGQTLQTFTANYPQSEVRLSISDTMDYAVAVIIITSKLGQI